VISESELVVVTEERRDGGRVSFCSREREDTSRKEKKLTSKSNRFLVEPDLSLHPPTSFDPRY